MPKNPTRAVELLQESVVRRSRLGMYRLARLYLDGEIVERDDHRAFKLYAQSAELGLVGAKRMLAWMYEVGRGTERNPAEAARLYGEIADIES